MIKVEGLNKYYNKGKTNELHVINNTTIELSDTGLVCILGESGSGKTTLMNTISGLDDFENGIIDVDGVEIKKYGDANQERVRNEKFGYIFQNYYLLQDRTVEYNLMLALGLYNISDEEKAERIDYVLKAVDMWRYKKRLVSQLSGGQQQRIAIARALAKSPKVIFADEPTGNLDEANTMRIMGVLKKISEKCLVVVVTHEKSIADFFADRILWIADGRIMDDKDGTGTGVYSYVEDTNLYLGEYEKKELKDENINIEVFSNGQRADIELKIVCDKGKIYISLGEAKNIEVLTADSEKKILEGTKPVIEMTDMEDIDYSLKELAYAKKPKLTFKEIRAIALANIKAMGKRQIFLVISLLAMSIMMVLAIQDIMTIIAVHEEEVVSTDSHYLELVMEKGDMIASTEFLKYKQRFMNYIKEDGQIYDMIVLNPDTTLVYTYTGFSQLENVKVPISNFSFVPLDKLSADSIIYGEMPEKSDEIVVDKWVLEQYIKNSNELSNVINNIRHFVGKEVTAANGLKLKITGICETEQMDIYIEKDVISATGNYMNTYKTYSDFMENYAGKYTGEGTAYTGKAPGYDEESGQYEILVSKSEFESNYLIYAQSQYSKVSMYESALENYERDKAEYEVVLEYIEKGWTGEETKAIWEETLEKDKKNVDSAFKEMTEQLGVDTYEECVAMRRDYSQYTYTKTAKTGGMYKVVGFYENKLAEEMNVEMVLADEAQKYIMPEIIANMGKCYIYAESETGMEEYLNAVSSKIGKALVVKLSNPYDTVMKEYRQDKGEQFRGRIIVTATIFVVSMIILYFMMKTNAVQRMQDLGVYRLIGISKTSILGLFAFENVIITSYTSLVGAVLATFATNLVSSIPSLDVEINYPWYAFAATIIFLYGINVLIGIFPIRKILRLPPAQLAAKYDI